MKYFGMPLGMWAVFAKSFEKQLSVLGYDAVAAKGYREESQAEVSGDLTRFAGI